MPSIFRSFCLLVPALLLVSPSDALAQRASRPPASPAARPGAAPNEAAEIAGGWALLGQGNVAQAAKKAAEVLAAHPRSAGAVALAIEAELARGGAAAGLTLYERWLGQRTLEEPLLVRRVARTLLYEEAAQQHDPTARAEAIRALTEDGEQVSADDRGATRSGGAAARAAAATTGDELAVKALVEQLKVRPDVRTMAALGNSGSKLAVAPLTAALNDSRSEVRAAAAEALGKINDPGSVAAIKPLLKDRNAFVRIQAAGALARMGDLSGLPMLEQLMADPSPEMRLSAVEALAGNPDANWTATVRDLTTVPNPEVQARAARLLGPHDPEAARRVLESLAADENPAIRELASQGLGEAATSDLTELRALMKNNVRQSRVRAAARVLALTR
jgi:HEAT repeat protein